MRWLPEANESAWKTSCREWSTDSEIKLILCTHWSKPLELSTPPIRCFLFEGCPKPLFMNVEDFEWGLYRGPGEDGSVLSCNKVISCCCIEVPLLLVGIPSGTERLSCRDHFFTSEPPIAYRAFCHSGFSHINDKI